MELLNANPSYAHVRFQDGRESTVSLRHLAPAGQERTSEDHTEITTLPPSSPNRLHKGMNAEGEEEHCPYNDPSENGPVEEKSSDLSPVAFHPQNPVTFVPSPPALRRSQRLRKPPKYLEDYVTS